MLYVNAEVAIKKWKERLNKLEELKATNPNATLLFLFPSITCRADVEMDGTVMYRVGKISELLLF